MLQIKCFLLCLVFLGTTSVVSAKGNKIEHKADKKEELKKDSTSTDASNKDNTLFEFCKTLSAEAEQNEKLQDELSDLKSSIDRNDNRLKELCKNVDYEKSKADYDTLALKLNRLDRSIYNTCILYPMEIRCDTIWLDITDNLKDSFNRLPVAKSPDFTKFDDTYSPLLKKYEEYNKALKTVIQNIIDDIKLNNNELDTFTAQEKIRNLKATPYYKDCYLSRNKPPYKSIIYLDNAYDSLFKILNKRGKVRADLEKLKHSL